MTRGKRWIAFAAIAAFALAGCGKAPADKGHGASPATVEETGVPGVKRITLTPKAAERIGIEFGEVKAVGQRLVAPYNALFYDAHGGEWVYVSPQPLVFERAPIKVERIEGDNMYLSKGLEPGTQVVTVGAAMLFGAESGL